MDDPFVFLGLFPFCVPTVDSIEELNQQIAESTEDYSGSFAGSAYPLELTLKQAMALFWRTKQINFDFEIKSEVFDEDGNLTYYEKVYPTNKEATFSGNEEILSAENTYQALLARICGNPYDLSFEQVYEYFFLADELESKTIGNYIGWFANSADYGSEMYDFNISMLRCVKIFDPSIGDDINDVNNYKYYPSININASTYNNLYTTFFPHFITYYEGGFNYSQTGDDTKEIKIKFGNEEKTISIYEIELFNQNEEFSDQAEVFFSDWTVELWPEI